MKCSQCNEKRDSVGDIRACEQCAGDGTASQLSEMWSADTIEYAIGQVPGLGNRFKPDEAVPFEPPQPKRETTAVTTTKKIRADKKASKGAQALKRKAPPPKSKKAKKK